MSRTLVFDIEANGLLPTVTTIHCLCIADPESGEHWEFGPDQIDEGLALLYGADCLVAHNGLDYDFRALAKVKGWYPRPGTRRLDTMVVARTLHSDIKRQDKQRIGFPKELTGRHSLEAWGERLGFPKTHYEADWDTFTPEMLTYCANDVAVNVRLLQHLRPWEFPRAPLDLEHEVHLICLDIEDAGWPFDERAAKNLYLVLVERRDLLERQLVAKFGQWKEVDRVLVPKRDNKTLGYVKGVPVTKYKTVVFNPGSRLHIERKLKELGWVPEAFTESGRAKLDEEILLKIDIPEAALLVEFLLVQKRLGQLADGDGGWLKMVRSDGRIHGRYNPIGTNTFRASHFSPNIAQVPSVGSAKKPTPYGRESRALFGVPRGWKLVGADMSGLELRCLAHYLASFDGGAYGKVVTEGDIHTFHMEAAGLPTRDNAKTFIYAWLYGAGDAKIGSIVKGTKAHGAKLNKTFMQRIPAIGKLKRAVEAACGKRWLKGLDGRQCPIRSEHSALNVLLQSAGAILCKLWMRASMEALRKRFRYGWDGDFVLVGWIHDELQFAVREEHAQELGEIVVRCARASGESVGFKVPLDSEFKIGNNWADTH